ncbi:hypothetical protein H4R99_001583 [Coemansia sp. RSA 1722]|nr:hypothetical protein LPJ57_001727 [Coemansia sp. RSA 486]KAJ2233667.1 hypothetical protein IWW45_003997 [Coemansia sp. RSA 485]KAJ2604810.1 hypothetical protein H4R99_001583 [Coemansia sp. RSA 1722]KAJ2640186.1 hypothetical protein GGF40_000334 [Coemansia sp. RSA 1286]
METKHKQQIDQCAQLLSSQSTDDEKLAGLLLLPRIIDAQDGDSLALVFESMDSRFLERLLRTGIKQHLKNQDDSPMLGIAAYVIDVFASHQKIAQHPRMLDRIPTLYRAASLGIPGVSAEAMQALGKILALDAGAQRILDRSELFVDAVSETELRNMDVAGFVLKRCSEFIHLHDDISIYAHGWGCLVGKFSSMFDAARDMVKFELMSVLASCLEPLDSDDAAGIDAVDSCLRVVSAISSGCAWILSQKSEPTKYTDQALVLYSHLARLWPSHAYSRDPPYPDLTKNSELALRLACIEGQASLDGMMICAPLDKKAGKMTLEQEAKKEKERLKLGWKYPVCAEIASGWLEWIGRWLDEQPDQIEPANGAEKQQEEEQEQTIYKLMSEVQKLSEASVGFLCDWKDRTRDDLQMLSSAPELVLSAMHLLGAWLATDPKLHKPAIPILPMCATWILQGGNDGAVIKEYMRPCISFALDTCDVSEMHYVDDLKTRESRYARPKTLEFASPWVGSIEFDDLSRAVYNIPSDEDILRARQSQAR